MMQWPYPVQSHTIGEILKAVCSTKWQDFRESLKGLSTSEKLERLHKYYHDNYLNPKTQVRVDNYINALKRGGRLDEQCRVK